MTTPFLLDIGFSKIQIANIVKVIGLIATLLGLFAGGLLVSRYSLFFTLLIGGVLQMFSNLFFAFQAIMGVNTNVLMITISIENIAGGIGTAAFLAYLSILVDHGYTATQFALLTSFMALSRTQILLENNSKWICFFVATTVFALPGLLLLRRANKI